MSAPVTCMENIIGLSRTDCECVEARPVDAGISYSDIWLDETEGLNIKLIDAKRDCGQDGLWTMMSRARQNAITGTKTDLMMCLNDKAELRRQAGQSQIGDDRKSTASGLKLKSAYHGMTLQLAKIKGGSFMVDSIGMMMKSTGTVVVNVYDRYTVDPIASITVYFQANQLVWTDLPVPLHLDMSPMGYQAARYWFLFTPVPDGDQPMQAMNSLVNCGCGGFEPYWNLDRPQYESSNQKAGKAWAEWSMATGTYGGTLGERESWVTGMNQTQGMLLRVSANCDEQTTYCPDQPNYQTDGFQRSLAAAVQYRAAMALVSDILTSSNINRYTMTAGEILQGLRRMYESRYNKYLTEFLCPTLTLPANVNRYGDCHKCKDTYGMSVGLIRA